MKTHIDLFSGIGGFALAAKWCGYETIVFCEKDEWCQRVLAKNFGAVVADRKGNGLEVGRMAQQEQTGLTNGCREIPIIIPDIFDFDGTKWGGATLLTGGFPCQPFSVAGKRRGKEDDRHLWPEMLRVISEARPRWVIGENVAGFVPMELDNCLSDLDGIGYETQAFVIPACAVDAPHRRDRVWIVAHSEGNGNVRESRNLCQKDGRQRESLSGKFRRAGDVAYGESAGQQGGVDGQGQEQSWRSDTPNGGCCNWEPEPNVGRVANGVPRRVDRLKGLGNAIVPQVAYEIMRAISS